MILFIVLWGVLSAASFVRAIELNDFWMEILTIFDIIVVSIILVGCFC